MCMCQCGVKVKRLMNSVLIADRQTIQLSAAATHTKKRTHTQAQKHLCL